MKTLILAAILPIALAACGKKDTEIQAITEPPASMENATFLITEFPPEQLVSTPVPVRIPGVDSRAIRPGEVRTPGIACVIYQRHETPPPPHPPN